MKKLTLILAAIITALSLSSCDINTIIDIADILISQDGYITNEYINADDIPDYSGRDTIEINGNMPYFDDTELVTRSFERYSALDDLGRCGVAYACLGTDLMPKGKRGNISSVKPSGWHSVQYDFVDSLSLYNRCHLIGWQLSGEDANERNLITGTRYLNATLMLPFENMVADYIKETDNHVMYRVTPYFEGTDLVAKGVLMEARSVEDDDICYNVFCYNVQPGVEIDYATGSSKAVKRSGQTKRYILNNNSKKFHLPSCPSVYEIRNKQDYKGSRDILIQQGYTPCSQCRP